MTAPATATCEGAPSWLLATARAGCAATFPAAGARVLGLVMLSEESLGVLAPLHPQPDQGAFHPPAVLHPAEANIKQTIKEAKIQLQRPEAVTIEAASFPHSVAVPSTGIVREVSFLQRIRKFLATTQRKGIRAE